MSEGRSYQSASSCLFRRSRGRFSEPVQPRRGARVDRSVELNAAMSRPVIARLISAVIDTYSACTPLPDCTAAAPSYFYRRRLTVCLFVRSITQKRMIPKCSNLVHGMTWFWDSRVKGQLSHSVNNTTQWHSISNYTITFHSYSIGGDTDKSNTVWVRNSMNIF